MSPVSALSPPPPTVVARPVSVDLPTPSHWQDCFLSATIVTFLLHLSGRRRPRQPQPGFIRAGGSGLHKVVSLLLGFPELFFVVLIGSDAGAHPPTGLGSGSLRMPHDGARGTTSSGRNAQHAQVVQAPLSHSSFSPLFLHLVHFHIWSPVMGTASPCVNHRPGHPADNVEALPPGRQPLRLPDQHQV